MRDGAGGEFHALGDLSTQADDLFLVDALALAGGGLGRPGLEMGIEVGIGDAAFGPVPMT